MTHDNIDKRQQRRDVGQEIHQVEATIHASRLAIKGLMQEEPVDREAVAQHYAAMRAAHRERHELQPDLDDAKRPLYPISQQQPAVMKPWR